MKDTGTLILLMILLVVLSGVGATNSHLDTVQEEVVRVSVEFEGENLVLKEKIKSLELELAESKRSQSTVLQFLELMTYDAILGRPDEVDLWMQICRQELGGSQNGIINE